jgi:hypothetical protein
LFALSARTRQLGLLKKKVFQKHKIVLKIDRNYGYTK